jgi:hypothetical protein
VCESAYIIIPDLEAFLKTYGFTKITSFIILWSASLRQFQCDPKSGKDENPLSRLQV